MRLPNKERNHKVYNYVGRMETAKVKPSRDEIFQSKNKGDFNLYNRKPQRDWRSSSK